MIKIGDLNINKLCVGDSEVSKVYLGDTEVYSSGPAPEPAYSAMPLTFEIISGGTISWWASNFSYTKEIFYSVNDGEWTSIVSTSEGTPINLSTGDIVKFKGDGPANQSSRKQNSFRNGTIVFNVYGNIMSLIDSTGYTTATTLSNFSFGELFYGQTGLISAEHLILPATTAYICYQNTFAGCTSLTKAPALPATALATQSYDGMFINCSNLNYIKCLATDISADRCTNSWVSGVAASGTFIKDASMTGWTTGASGIPSGWTVQDA